MNAKTLLPLLLLTGLVSTARAQITITEADVRNRIGTINTTTYYTATSLTGLQAIADGTGGNLTFDLRTAAFDAGETYTIELISCSADLPGCNDPDFATANFIAREVYPGATADSVFLSFGRLATDGFYILGGASRGDFDDTTPGLEESIFKFNPALLSERLPLTMGTSWTASTTLESPDFEGVVFSLDESYDVEGWGTLTTPAGSASALKIRNRSITSFSVAGQTFIDTTYAITLVTKSEHSATLELDGQGQVIGAEYVLGGNIDLDAESEAEIPRAIALEQNYPNPFNPRTTIPFTLHQAGHVTLTVFDLLGRNVAVLVDEVRPVGTYTATWQPANLPSGVYLYRLSAGDVSITRRLTLLK